MQERMAKYLPGYAPVEKISGTEARQTEKKKNYH